MQKELLSRFQKELATGSQMGTALAVRQSSPSHEARSDATLCVPSASLLRFSAQTRTSPSTDYSDKIKELYADFGLPVNAKVAHCGPRLYQYAITPGVISKEVKGKMVRRRVKVSALTKLEEDLALALACKLRLTKPDSKPYLGLEIPRPDPQLVSLVEVLSCDDFAKIELEGGLGLALGLEVTGQPVVADLTACPHLLIAGATNSGKSVCIHAVLCSLLMNHGPDSLQLLLVDPKRVELTAYRGLPHLVRPVITKVEQATTALSWATDEMERRFDLLSKAGQRNILRYNEWARSTGKETLPYLVIVVDELADLMMQSKDEVEPLICRLAQMARAVGIHLVLATQRPSVSVVTGLIKANIPARIAFQTASSTDSRVILDAVGAEKLLGLGDCLVRLSGVGFSRTQGCLVLDEELEAITAHWARVQVDGKAEVIEGTYRELSADELLQRATRVVEQEGKASVSLLQRRLRVPYMRAAQLVEALRERRVLAITWLSNFFLLPRWRTKDVTRCYIKPSRLKFTSIDAELLDEQFCIVNGVYNYCVAKSREWRRFGSSKRARLMMPRESVRSFIRSLASVAHLDSRA